MVDPKFRSLADGFFVSPHITLEDIDDAHAAGIKTIINNRPDEEDPSQLCHQEARTKAEALGMAYSYIPVVSGAMTTEDLAQMRDTIADAEKPILAYCRTGTRCTFLWAFVQAEHSTPSELIECAGKAGYDISAAHMALRSINERGGA